MDRMTDPNRIIEDALSTYPMAAVPPGLSAAVMAQVRALSLKPRFRLSWMDYAVSLFVSGMASLFLLVWQLLPPNLTARLRLQLLLTERFLEINSLWPIIVVGIVLAVAALIVAALLFARSRRPRFLPSLPG
jgi:hypothetical protein